MITNIRFLLLLALLNLNLLSCSYSDEEDAREFLSEAIVYILNSESNIELYVKDNVVKEWFSANRVEMIPEFLIELSDYEKGNNYSYIVSMNNAKTKKKYGFFVVYVAKEDRFWVRGAVKR